MSGERIEENGFLQDPAAEALAAFERDPNSLEKEQLLILVHGLTGIIAGLREDVSARDDVIDSLGRRLEHAELVAEEEKKYDHKTGLLTAEAFQNVVEDDIERKRQDIAFGRRPSDKPTSNYLVFIDLDDFRFLNEVLNNHVVDQEILLPAVARILKAVREDDHVGRHGGDEFLVFLKDVDEAGARTITERIKSHINTVRTDYPQFGSKLGASIGVAEYTVDTTYDEVFKAAHAEHKNSKRSGSKNEVHFASTN